jgi:spore germination protein KA
VGEVKRLIAGVESNDINNNSTIKNSGQKFQGERLSVVLNYNLDKIKDMFYYPENVDFIIREIEIKSLNRNAVLVFIHGAVEDDVIQRYIITPLLECNLKESNEELGTAIMKRIISARTVKKVIYFEEIAKRIVSGETLILIQDYEEAISVSTYGYESRGIEPPTAENVIKGPKEAFTESVNTNRSLVRKYLKCENLITESIILPNIGISHIFLLYMKGKSNLNVITTVKNRIEAITSESIDTLSMLEQHIEDRPYSMIPTILLTERPDKTVSFLKDGHVAIFMDGSPYALIVPVTFWSFFHSPEDVHQRKLYGMFIRIIRLIAVYFSLLAPSLYMAMTNYHIDMIPTELVLAIAATRQGVPLPAFMEVLLMELSFEILREAGIRVPTPIGPTIGVVGALILGQAAVQASIVSPILVVVVAITGLSSFAITENSLNYTIRITRFIFLFSAMILGFFGLAACFICCITYASTVKSFGVPFFSPLAPHNDSAENTILPQSMNNVLLEPIIFKLKNMVRKYAKKRS